MQRRESNRLLKEEALGLRDDVRDALDLQERIQDLEGEVKSLRVELGVSLMNFYSLAEAAHRLHVHHLTIRRYIRYGKLGAILVFNRSYLLREEVDDMADLGGVNE